MSTEWKPEHTSLPGDRVQCARSHRDDASTWNASNGTSSLLFTADLAATTREISPTYQKSNGPRPVVSFNIRFVSFVKQNLIDSRYTTTAVCNDFNVTQLTYCVACSCNAHRTKNVRSSSRAAVEPDSHSGTCHYSLYKEVPLSLRLEHFYIFSINCTKRDRQQSSCLSVFSASMNLHRMSHLTPAIKAEPPCVSSGFCDTFN